MASEVLGRSRLVGKVCLSIMMFPYAQLEASCFELALS
jgi:hypothetical protein